MMVFRCLLLFATRKSRSVPGGHHQYQDREGGTFFLLQVAHYLDSALSPWATLLCLKLFPAQGEAISNSRCVWQQVQRLPDSILAAVLRASALALPLATKLEHAPEACHAAVCSSALDMCDGLDGSSLDGNSLHTCFAVLSSMP
jgi:hypothetical protein